MNCMLKSFPRIRLCSKVGIIFVKDIKTILCNLLLTMASIIYWQSVLKRSARSRSNSLRFLSLFSSSHWTRKTYFFFKCPFFHGTGKNLKLHLFPHGIFNYLLVPVSVSLCHPMGPLMLLSIPFHVTPWPTHHCSFLFTSPLVGLCRWLPGASWESYSGGHSMCHMWCFLLCTC